MPGIAGLGVAGKAALALNGGRIIEHTRAHSLAVAVWASCGLLLAAALTTGLNIYRGRILPSHVRAGLRGDHVNAVLAWVRAAGAVVFAISASVLVAPQGTHISRTVGIVMAATGCGLIWLSLHFRVGPRLTARDLRHWFTPHRRTNQT